MGSIYSHIDLEAANKRKITVAEVSGSNVVSVAEYVFARFFSLVSLINRLTNLDRHVIMSILLLVRNFVPAHEQIQADDWNVANIARNAFDLEGKVVGTVGCGRIGYRVLQRLQPFECKELLWFDYTDLPAGKFKPVLSPGLAHL